MPIAAHRGSFAKFDTYKSSSPLGLAGHKPLREYCEVFESMPSASRSQNSSTRSERLPTRRAAGVTWPLVKAALICFLLGLGVPGGVDSRYFPCSVCTTGYHCLCRLRYGGLAWSCPERWYFGQTLRERCCVSFIWHGDVGDVTP